MNRSTVRTPRHRMVLGVIGLSLALTMTVSCSSDKSDSSDKTTTTAATGSTSGASDEFCQAARDALNLTPDKLLGGVEAQQKLAPDELADDYDQIVVFLKYSDENPNDQPGIAERSKEIAPSLIKVTQYLKANCDVEVNLLGS